MTHPWAQGTARHGTAQGCKEYGRWKHASGMPRYAAAKPRAPPSRGGSSGTKVRGVGSASRGPSKAQLLGSPEITNLVGQAQDQSAEDGESHEHLSRIRVAADLGIAGVPLAQRIDVGFKKDASKYATPDADFMCWGWMIKKGGIRKNWLERFFEVTEEGTLRYFASSNEKPVKKGGTTKSQMCGYDEKGVVELKDVEDIRMSTAPNAEPGEIEIVAAERTYRMAPGRAQGTPILDKAKAGQTWLLCLTLAKIAASGDASEEMVAKARQAADALAA